MKPLNYKLVSAFAPASIGNVAAGFDVLGLAIEPISGEALGDRVEVRPAKGEETTLVVKGAFGPRLPKDPQTNLVMRCRDLFEGEVGEALPPLELCLHKDLPLASGMGSSSASVVATLLALNTAFDEPLDQGALLRLAGEGEGIFSGAPHLDNVAPCLIGGMALIRDDGEVRSLPWPALPMAVVHPDIEVPTERSRRAIPKDIPLAKAVAYWQNLACFVDGIHRGDRGWMARGLRDLWVEGHRQHLVPGFAKAMEGAKALGVMGGSLSGSGPSVFVVGESAEQAEAARRVMVQAFESKGLSCHSWVCSPSATGARVLKKEER